jgi:hypothetical protein
MPDRINVEATIVVSSSRQQDNFENYFYHARVGSI